MNSFLKLLAAWAAFGVAFVVGGLLDGVLHLRINLPVDHTPIPIRLLAFAAAGAVLVAGLWPLARGLAAGSQARSAVLAVFVFLALGANSIFDGAIYTSAFDGAFASSLLMYLLLAALLGSTLGWGFGGLSGATGFARHGVVSLGGRTILAFAAWPLIYMIFGAMIAPIVLPYYEGGVIPGLHIPPLPTILGVQLVRSLIFLASSLPLILFWKGSRRSLWLALGLAHAVAVGLFGMVAATALPAVLRVTHSAEITCDSFAYAGLLVLLFAAPSTNKERLVGAGSFAQGMRSTS
jgi:hypothetical protein